MSPGNSLMDANGSRTLYNDSAAEMKFCGVLMEGHQELLRLTYNDSLSRLAREWRQSLARKQVFSINLWRRSGGGDRVERIED